MKILRTKFFGEVIYKTPSLNLGFKNYKYIKEYKGKERTELNDYIQNERGGKNCWLKDYICVAGAIDDFSQFIPDLYYNKKDRKWYMFNSENDPIQKMKEEDVVKLVKSPKDWAESVEEEILETTEKQKKFSQSDDLGIMKIPRTKIFSEPSDTCVVEDIFLKDNGFFRDKTTIITTTLPKNTTFKVGDVIKLSEDGKKIKITGIRQGVKNSIAITVGTTPISQIKRGDKIIKL